MPIFDFDVVIRSSISISINIIISPLFAWFRTKGSDPSWHARTTRTHEIPNQIFIYFRNRLFPKAKGLERKAGRAPSPTDSLVGCSPNLIKARKYSSPGMLCPVLLVPVGGCCWWNTPCYICICLWPCEGVHRAVCPVCVWMVNRIKFS